MKNKPIAAMVIFILATLALTATAYGSNIRVGLLRSAWNRDSIQVSSTSIEVGRGGYGGSFIYNRTLTSATGFTLQVSGGQVVIQSGGSTLFTFTNDAYGTPKIRGSAGEPVAMGSYSYRGALEFTINGGRINTVNVISLEEYLYGVLPMEVPQHFHPQAKQAQAVAARTFALYSINSGRHRAQGFDICDNTHCQVYHGASREQESTTEAVRATHRLAIFAPGGDTPLFTPYFSSSGGATDNTENVWNDNLPHLRGVLDPFETNPRIWSRTYTWAQLTNAVRAEAPNANIGNVTSISVRTEHPGRVQEVTFHGTNGNWSATRQGILTVFRHIDRSLYSRNFYIPGSVGGGGSTTMASTITIFDGHTMVDTPATNLQAVDATGHIGTVTSPNAFDGSLTRFLLETTTATGIATFSGGNGITINGRGWGHGVGMSQNGANGMAQAGFTFLEILHHYYTNVEIREH